MTNYIMPELGQCYKTESQIPLYEEPWVSGGSQSEEIICGLLPDDIFLLLEHAPINSTLLSKPYHFTENFKVLIDNKIGWLTLRKDQMSRIFCGLNE